MRTVLAGLLASMAFGAAAQAQEAAAPWPHPADIPSPGPVALAPAGQGAPDVTRYVLVRGAGAAGLSPDGRTVAYLSSVTGEPQVWVVPAAGGASRQLTFGEGVDGFEWLPDGSGLLYWADAAGNGRVGLTAITLDGRKETVVLARSQAFVRPGGFTSDGKRFVFSSTARNGRDFDVYVVGVDGAAPPRLIKQGQGGFYVDKVSPTAPEALVTTARGEDGADLHLLNLDTGALRTLAKPKEAAKHESFAWLPDGSAFYLATDNGRDFTGLARMDARTGALTYVETPDYDVLAVKLTADGRYISWIEDRGGVFTPRVRDLRSGRDVALPKLPVGAMELEVAARAPTAAILVNGPRSVGEVQVVDLTTGAASKVVETAWVGLDPATMVEPERVTFKARDGVTLSGLYYRPPGVTGRPPALLELHGGPSAHAVAAYAPDLQYYLSRGIAVLDFNYRGSTGAGKKHAGLNDRRERPKELNDLLDAVKWLGDTGRADPARMAVGGGSYGGYLTNAVLGAHPGVFKAAYSQVGVSDWVKAMEGASPMLKASDKIEYGDIDDPADRAFMASISPINNVAKIKTPVLVQHGANDPQDPVTESDRLVEGIRKAGGEVVYLRFADEGHGVTKTANRVHMYRAIAAFLEEKLGLKSAAAD